MLLKNVHLGLLLHFIFVIIASAKSLRDHSDDSRFLHYDGEEEDHDSTVPTWKISSSPNKKDSDDDELRYFVEFNENSSEYQMRLSNAKRIHSTLKPEDASHVAVNLFLPDDNVEVVTFQSKEEMVKWKQNPEVKRIERDSKIYKYQSKENIPYGVERVKALDIPDNFVNNRKVCVIDSGYDTTHQDLPSAETGGEVTGAEGVNAYAWDQDSDGHGTHVAGTIAALGGNKKGVVGVVRNGKLKLHIVRVFGASDEWVWASSLASAVQECVNAGANIVNMSLGGKGSSTVEEQLYERFLTQNNVLLIAAAGNDGNDAKSYPASYDSVMSVAALKNNNVVASFSQKNDKVDISAPGVGILSTLPGNRYGSWQGTSMATPHVSGVAALIWSHYPTKTAQEIWNTLTESALDLGEPGRDDSYGHGLIQADKAIELLGGIVETSSPSEIPTVEPSAVPSLSPSLPPTDLPTSTSVPTMIPSIHPSPSPSSCFDYPNWHDKFGLSFNCEFYEINNKCELYGDSFAGHHNKTANQACCACGGGTSSAQPTVTPTISPTRRTPSLSPTKSPSIRPVGVSKPSLQQGGCFDDPPGWHDALSSSYDCSYYEKNNECNAFGDMFRGVGNKTAKEACCFCGGGNIKVSNTPSSSPNGGFS